MSSFDKRGGLDISTPRIILCVGKKRSGKSVMARYIFDSYPYDRFVVDVNGDDGPTHKDDPQLTDLHGDVSTLPVRWPEHLRDEQKRMTLRYVPDAGSPTFIEDMDAAVGLARTHRRTGILIHEMGILAQSNRVPAHTRRALMSNRHTVAGKGNSGETTLILCAPRTLTMEPLVIAQADVVYVFDLPNQADRKRVAEEIGWDPADFVAYCNDLGPHEYLRYDANQARPERPEDDDLRLIHCPALPEDIVKSVT